MPSPRIILICLLLLSIGCFFWGAHDVRWALQRESAFDAYWQDQPPPYDMQFWKHVHDSRRNGTRLCSIGLMGASAAVAALCVMKYSAKRAARARGFEVIQ